MYYANETKQTNKQNFKKRGENSISAYFFNQESYN